MAKRVFDTYHASDEEIEGVKAALEEANIQHYETVKGNWWVGSAAIWISEDDEYEKARKAIETFQVKWQESIRSEPPKSINWYALLIAVVAILFILYLNFFWLF